MEEPVLLGQPQAQLPDSISNNCSWETVNAQAVTVTLVMENAFWLGIAFLRHSKKLLKTGETCPSETLKGNL